MDDLIWSNRSAGCLTKVGRLTDHHILNRKVGRTLPFSSVGLVASFPGKSLHILLNRLQPAGPIQKRIMCGFISGGMECDRPCVPALCIHGGTLQKQSVSSIFLQPPLCWYQHPLLAEWQSESSLFWNTIKKRIYQITWWRCCAKSLHYFLWFQPFVCDPQTECQWLRSTGPTKAGLRRIP